jgi:malic enzyme
MATGHQSKATPRQVSLRGAELLNNALLSKDTAFTEEERDAFGLRGLLPAYVASIERQVSLELERIRRKQDDLEKYIGLSSLLHRNETLFARLLAEHLEELAPIIYTPTVGRACQELSHVMRRPRGIWITLDDVDRIPEMLRNAGKPDVRLIVATDNERILGLGDLGAGGMGIPIGKLALYTAGAGLHPAELLPVSLDVGTDNETLLADPHYVGWRGPRVRGEQYEQFLEAFVAAVTMVFPHALLQWEDFKQQNAMMVLERYRKRLPSFNDDIQGTAAVALAGIYTAMRAVGGSLAEQRLVFLGAGAAGLGIAHLVRTAARRDGGDAPVIAMLDSRGLIYEGREGVGEEKRAFALSSADMARLGLHSGATLPLEEVVRAMHPTVMVGTSGVRGTFSEAAVREMAHHTVAPVLFPLSNPTSLTEATPTEIMKWTDGRALVATGSPFAPVTVGGQERAIGQANNTFIFPGVGLGAIVADAREITDEMFLVAAKVLSEQVSKERLAGGALYPALSDLRNVSRAIAVAVAAECGLSGNVEDAVDAAMWWPEYVRYEAT